MYVILWWQSLWFKVRQLKVYLKPWLSLRLGIPIGAHERLAELVALEEVFAATTVHLCDFHREQAWGRWAKDHKHGSSQSEAEELLTLLCACAWADPTSAYKLAVNDLKQSAVWNIHGQNGLQRSG